MTDEDSTDDEDHRDLSHIFRNSMSLKKEKGGKKSKGVSYTPMPMCLPHIMYVWKDVKRTDMVTIEIHLPAATVPGEIDMRLVTKKGKQVFELTNTLSTVLLDQRTFEETYSERPITVDEREWFKDFASCTMARSHAIKKLTNKHCHTTDVKKDFAKLRMEIVLPFFCEDIFSMENYHGSYTHAGTKFKTWTTTDEDAEEVMMQVLEITLASVVREKGELKVNTPQRKEKAAIVFRRR